MYNPFFPFIPKLLKGLVDSKHRYYVRQTLIRIGALEEKEVKGYFLITHYSKLSDAEQHFNQLPNDPHRFLYDWNNIEHRKKLVTVASKPEYYRIYSSVLQVDWQERISKNLKKKIRTYIEHHLQWHVSRDEVLMPEIFVQFGELFVTLKWGNRTAKVKFEDIERFK